MAVKRKYRLNLRNYGNLPAIMLSQYDEGYALEFEIRDGTDAASDLSAYTVTLKGTRADTLAYSFAGTVSTNVLTFVIDTTMTACAGRGTAEIAIKDTANDVLFATFNMPVFVERAAVPEGSIDADVERAQEIAEEVEELIDGATEGAEAWAVGQRGGVDVESTDETYHNNAKYYAEQAADSAASIGIDATLTQAGKAADAKKTGDEINELKEDLNIVSYDVYAFDSIAKTPNATDNGYKLNADTGKAVADASYSIVKFAVTAGDVIKIITDGDFQFQTDSTVTITAPSHRVGKTYGAGTYTFTVPATVTYLIFSVLTGTGTSNVYDNQSYIRRNDMAYVASNNIGWTYSGASCSLTISGAVIIRDYAHANSTIEISKDTILTKAGQYSSVSVSGNTITGNAFAIYYDYTSGEVIVGALNVKNVYKNTLLLFGWYWGAYIGGALLESNNLFEIKSIYPKIDLRQRIAVAYVSNNGITWDYTGTTCNVTITDSIVIRDYTSSNGSRIISKSDVLATVSQASISGVTVSGDTISGSNFAIYYDFIAGVIKAGSMNPNTLYNDTILLFGHYWGSFTGGALVESRNAKTYDQVQTIQAGLDTLSPFVVPSYLISEVASVVSSIKDACTEKAMVIAFTTDNHYGASNGSNWPDTINSIKAINSKYALDAVIDGGDMINGDEVVSTSKNRLSTMLSNMDIPNVRAYGIVGNHDDNSFTSDREVQIPQDDLYALIGRPTIKNYDAFDNNKVYGYKDYPVYGIRLVVMDARIDDTNIGDNTANWGYDTDQVNWFINTALDTDLQVVVFSHMGLTPEYSGSAQGTYPVNGTTIRTAIESFIGNGGVFVGWFHGHTHWDFIGQYSNTNGFHEISTGCGRIVSGPIPSYAPEGATMQDRTAGTVTQELYDIIVIKPNSKEVDLIRFGAGSNRNFTY